MSPDSPSVLQFQVITTNIFRWHLSLYTSHYQLSVNVLLSNLKSDSWCTVSKHWTFFFLKPWKKKCQVIFWKIVVCCFDDKYHHLRYRAVRVQEQGLLATCSFLFACCIGWLTAPHEIRGESQSCYVYMYIAHGQCFVNKSFRNVYTSLHMKFALFCFVVSVKFCVRRRTRCMFKGLNSTLSKM